MKEKIICALSYLWILFFLPLVVLPGDKFGKFHANQALLNLIVGVVLAVVTRLIGWIPVIGWLISFVAGLISLVFVIWGIYHALTGQQKPYPIIGHITIIK